MRGLPFWWGNQCASTIYVMKMRRYTYLIPVLLFCTTVFIRGFSQDPAVRLRQWAEKSGGEKVFLHLNRTDLLCGEVMWFSFFAADQTSHKPSRVSQVGYVELLDQKGESLLQTSVFLDNGFASGSLYLPASLPTGTYLVRAFTLWMKNQDPAFAFTQPVTVINTLKSASAGPTDLRSSVSESIKFFPEGGNLVDGLTSQVAFHAVRNDGLGIAVKGWVIRDASDTVAAFRSIRYGLGKFTFRPLQGQTYRVVVLDDKNRRIAAELPEVRSSGVVIQVSDTLGQKLRVRLKGGTPGDRFNVLVHTRQSVRHNADITVGQGAADIILDRNLLEEGISHVTVFDAANRPISERLIFRRPGSSTVGVEVGQAVYTIRSQAKLKLNLPASGKYSISVFRSDSTQNSPGIVEKLLLTSDLRGTVEDPNFCFSDDPLANQVADLLMMTHGWRRFRWTDVMDGGPGPLSHIPEVRGHLLKATLIDTAGRPVAARNAILSGPGRKTRLYVAQSDSSGVVWFDLRKHALGKKLFVQPDLRVDSLLQARTESPFSWQAPVWQPRPVRIPLAAASELTRRSVAVQAADIYREKETFFSYKSVPTDTVPFYGSPDEEYRLDDYTRFPAMEEVFREYVRGVWVRRRDGHFRLRVLDRPANNVFEENPLVLVDGVPYPDIDQLMEVDPLRIRKLEVVARRYYLGPLRIPGILSLYSYAGDMAGLRADPRAAVIDYESLERQREFAYPAYDSPQARASRLPDPRYQLWFGRVTDIGSTINFTTSDVEGRFRVVVEGLTDEGLPVSGGAVFRVER